MPKRTYRPRKTRRRSRKSYRKRSRRLVFTKAPIPNKFAAKLRYWDWAVIDPGLAGTAGTYILSCNSLFDPNTTGVGHQPRGFDQYMTMYDHYTVIGCKVTAVFTQDYAGTYDPLVVGVALKDSATAYTDVNDYMEGRNIKSRTLAASTTGENPNAITITKTFSTRKFLGITHPLSSANCRGNATSGPGEQAYFHLFVAPITTNDNNQMRVHYRLEYLTIFTEPKQPSQS